MECRLGGRVLNVALERILLPPLPLLHSVKIANAFSVYIAYLMGVRVHSSCFVYTEAPDCSLPGAPELQSSWRCS